jgi:hypothetical protein
MPRALLLFILLLVVTCRSGRAQSSQSFPAALRRASYYVVQNPAACSRIRAGSDPGGAGNSQRARARRARPAIGRRKRQPKPAVWPSRYAPDRPLRAGGRHHAHHLDARCPRHPTGRAAPLAPRPYPRRCHPASRVPATAPPGVKSRYPPQRPGARPLPGWALRGARPWRVRADGGFSRPVRAHQVPPGRR